MSFVFSNLFLDSLGNLFNILYFIYSFLFVAT
jgi:hypothetical protein